MEVPLTLTSRFSEWVLPQVINAGCFGSGVKIIDFKLDPDRKGQDQFSSVVQFIELKVNLHDILKKINVLVKYQIDNVDILKFFFLKNQFYNEVLMYSEILPIIDKDGIVGEIFPKYYHGMVDQNVECNDRDYILLEDLSKKGFRLSNEKVFLDYDHCKLALKEIGRFHALSYAAKENKSVEFKAAVSKIKYKWSTESIENSKHVLRMCGERGVLPLIEKCGAVAEFLKKFLKNYDEPVKFYDSLVKPLEPEAVLCHGDFCRNNMLFRYDDSGKPVEVKFFDLQTPQYTSPVIDLSFFLLMNTNKETRETYWDELISIYSNSLNSAIPEIKVPELDFSRVALYGYINCSFFLPIMLADNDNKLPVEEYIKLTSYERGCSTSTIGGSIETEYLVDIIQFLLNKGYIREVYF